MQLGQPTLVLLSSGWKGVVQAGRVEPSLPGPANIVNFQIPPLHCLPMHLYVGQLYWQQYTSQTSDLMIGVVSRQIVVRWEKDIILCPTSQFPASASVLLTRNQIDSF